MKINLIILIFLFNFFISCEKKEIVVLIEQPTEKELDNVNLKLFVNENKTNFTLKYSNITPNFLTHRFKINNDTNYLTIHLLDKSFKYKILYPNEKYIIVSPFLNKNKLDIGIKKSSEKYNLH
jgi:hypothetical protein